MTKIYSSPNGALKFCLPRTFDITVWEKEKGRKEYIEKAVGFIWVSFLPNQLNENCTIKYIGIRSMTASLESKF